MYDGVEASDIGLTFEDRAEKLASLLSEQYGRAVSPNMRTAMTGENTSDLIQAAVDSVQLPDLLEPTEEDILRVCEDFPDLTEEEIMNEWETIQDIYLDQLSALSMRNVLTGIYEDPAARGVKFEDDAVFYNSNNVTIYEIAAMLCYPFSALTLVKQRDKAYELTLKYMGAAKRTDDKSDAFRHAILCITMAKEGWGLKKHKLGWAAAFSTAHEAGSKYEGTPSEMDLHNNNVGLRYYDSAASKKYTKILWFKIETGVSEPSYDTAAKAMKPKAVNAYFVDRALPAGTAKTQIRAIHADEMVYIIPDANTY
ncbi:DUF6973 domain-containing protein [Brucepastera parasyntrophica]|uniref:DUF6973 domain-containing protein n=1 Tax=Brucepastera parasyntrophica TaxID=2880008 RepID=UPI003F719451